MTDTALAVRNMSLAELGRRIDLNVKSGWGLERGTSAQLNLLALFCQKHQLLPGDDVTLYEGKPWITIDGRVKLMRRHKEEYRGHSTRPLSKDEKEAWGYDPDDLVIEATIQTVTYGEVKARGKVSKAERQGIRVEGVRHNPVAKHNPVEMAEKRALSRCERYTFGTDSVVDDEDVEEAARVVIQERNDPERNAAGAATYDRVIGSNYDDFPDQLTKVQPADESQGDLVKTKAHTAWKNWSFVAREAQLAEIEFDEIELPVAASVLRAATETLSEMVAAKSVAGTEQESFT